MTTRIDLAAALRAGGPALMAEAIASLRSVVLELNENATCGMVMRTDEEWLAGLLERAAAVPPANAPKLPTDLDVLRQVPGATGANAEPSLAVRLSQASLDCIELRAERDAHLARVQQLTGELGGVREQALLNTASFDRERDALTARVADLEAKLATCSQWAQGRDHARIAAVESLVEVERTIETIRAASTGCASQVCCDCGERVSQALSALSQPSKPEPQMVLGGFGAPGYGMQPAPVAETSKPAAAVEKLLEWSVDYDQTPEEATAELEASGVDVAAFSARVRATLDQPCAYCKRPRVEHVRPGATRAASGYMCFGFVEQALCPGCRKPFDSPDHDPLCSSCRESDTGERFPLEPAPVVEGEPRYGYAFPGRLPPGKPVAEPREIRVGSVWKQSVPPGQHLTVTIADADSIEFRWRGLGTQYESCPPSEFRVWFTHVSDPAYTKESA